MNKIDIIITALVILSSITAFLFIMCIVFHYALGVQRKSIEKNYSEYEVNNEISNNAYRGYERRLTVIENREKVFDIEDRLADLETQLKEHKDFNVKQHRDHIKSDTDLSVLNFHTQNTINYLIKSRDNHLDFINKIIDKYSKLLDKVNEISKAR
jgi:hypothetical protein